MRRTIWKFPLSLADEPQKRILPGIGRPLYVAMQGGFQLTLWAEVDEGDKDHAWEFKVIDTGHDVPEGGEWVYCGTALDGDFVWHVYGRVVP